MKLIKTKGIVVKEVPYGDNDKIVTVLTDKLGLVVCIAKGAKRTKSSLLAPTQYLVYSEFVLFKGTTFYHINSAEVINTFYNLKIDLDKLDLVYYMSKSLIYLTNENIDTQEILKIFLNSLYLIQEEKKNMIEVKNIFVIKMITILGFAPNINECSICNTSLKEKKEQVYYDYISNFFVCSTCNLKKTSRQVLIPYPCYTFVNYIIKLPISKVFTISLNEKYIEDLDKFGQALSDCIKNAV